MTQDNKAQRGPLLSSVFMVMLATAATGLLAVIGLQALPETVVPTTFRGDDQATRHVDVSEAPTPGKTARPSTQAPVPTATATVPAGRSTAGRTNETPRTRPTYNFPSNPGNPGTRAQQPPPPRQTTAPAKPRATTAPPRKTTSPSPTATKPAPQPTQSTQAPKPAPSCNGRKPGCPKSPSAPAVSSQMTSSSYSGSSSSTEAESYSSSKAKKTKKAPAKKSGGKAKRRAR